MKILGQVENLSFEQLSSDPLTSVQGRVWDNTTEGRTKTDDGVNKRALIKNDQKAVFGNDGTPANNIRIHKGPAGVLQTVPGGDVTAEGVTATLFNQLSTRAENVLSSSMPVNGNAGRSVFVTDQKVVGTDDGVVWRKIIPELAANDATAGGTITLAPVTTSVVRLTGVFTNLNMIPAGFDSQRVTLINRTGSDVTISHDSGATPADRIFSGTALNITFKSNSALTLQYDTTTSRWQVIGDAAGAAATGGLPNSTVQVVTTDYVALLTDDIILADTNSISINVTLPSPIGNSGKRYVIEKIHVSNIVTIVATINGVVNRVIPATPATSTGIYSPVEVVSDGTNWTTISSQNLHSALISTTTTFIVPPNTTKVSIFAVGGGGGGAGGAGGLANTTGGGGGGGGNGGYAHTVESVTVTAGETLSLTMGAAGTSGTGGASGGGGGAGGSGGRGGTTFVKRASGLSIATAFGGLGGSSVAAPTGGAGGNHAFGGAVAGGGTGSNGTSSVAGYQGAGGGGGGAAGGGVGGSADGVSGGAHGAAVSNAGGGGGAGGSTPFGIGGTGGAGNGTGGAPGSAGSSGAATNYGSGGGGGGGGYGLGGNGTAGGAGGAARAGAVIISWWQ